MRSWDLEVAIAQSSHETPQLAEQANNIPAAHASKIADCAYSESSAATGLIKGCCFAASGQGVSCYEKEKPKRNPKRCQSGIKTNCREY